MAALRMDLGEGGKVSNTGATSVNASMEPTRDCSLDSLVPELRARIEKLLVLAAGVNLNVGLFEGLRSPERQEWLHRRAKRQEWEAVPDGKVERSLHQDGKAADIVFKDLQA